MKDLTKALESLDATYNNVIGMANDMVYKCTKESDNIIKEINQNIENLSNDQIRDYMLRLSLTSYSFSEIKEKSAFKSECAETLRKERYAEEYSKAEGAVAMRDNTALLNTSEEVLVDAIFEHVANTLKVKLDEIHRVVDTLKSVLTSRLSEAKFMQMSVTNEIESTTNGSVSLNNINKEN